MQVKIHWELGETDLT